jgi:hypothetical protein
MLVAGLLNGCGGDVVPVVGTDDASSGVITRSEGAQAATAASSPAISGSAYPTVMAGQYYVFQPTVTGTSGTLTFKITNKPAWASFDTTTGKLWGTPVSTDVGAYKSIQVTVTDSKATATLAAFSITVTASPASQASVSLSWTAPTQNSDGSPLVDLEGYNVHYGTKSQTYSQVIKIANPGLTTYVVQNLSPGTYYFSVSAYNGKGVESNFSSEAAVTVN